VISWIALMRLAIGKTHQTIPQSRAERKAYGDKFESDDSNVE
jgi:hypothetical protein